MTRSLVCRDVVLVLLALLSACNFPDGDKENISGLGNPSGQAGTRVPLMTATPALTPTVITEKGKGELTHFHGISMEDANHGLMSSLVTGTIPFVIAFNSKRGVWEVKGNTLGAGTTEYNASSPSKISCRATWSVELTLSGVLVPMGGLIADQGDGCYIVVHILEDWKRLEAACSTHLGDASGLWDEDVSNAYGPLKFNLVEGEQKNELQKLPRTVLTSIWKLQNLDVPLETGCMTGSTFTR